MKYNAPAKERENVVTDEAHAACPGFARRNKKIAGGWNDNAKKYVKQQHIDHPNYKFVSS